MGPSTKKAQPAEVSLSCAKIELKPDGGASADAVGFAQHRIEILSEVAGALVSVEQLAVVHNMCWLLAEANAALPAPDCASASLVAPAFVKSLPPHESLLNVALSKS